MSFKICTGAKLRSLPFAALNDGEKFVIEKYNSKLNCQPLLVTQILKILVIHFIGRDLQLSVILGSYQLSVISYQSTVLAV